MNFKMKCISVFLASIMAFAMTACSKGADSSSSNSDQNQTSSQVVTESSTTEGGSSQDESFADGNSSQDESGNNDQVELSDREMDEQYGTTWLTEKQDVITQLSIKYSAPNFQQYSLQRTLNQLGWDYTQPVKVAGMIGSDATGIFYLEFDESLQQYAEECLNSYVNFLKNELDTTNFPELDLLRLEKIHCDVQNGRAIFILPGAWNYVETESTEDTGTESSSQVEEKTEMERFSDSIDYAIRDICSQMGM